jgi:dihydrofolate reductase
MDWVSIVAVSGQKRGIGMGNKLPWVIPGDMKHFQTLTTSTNNTNKLNVLIMGKRTWLSIPPKYRPLKNRINLILSRDEEFVDDVNDLEDPMIVAASSMAMASKWIDENREKVEQVFVIGGQQIYEEAINGGWCNKIYLTQLHKEFECDTFFPELVLDQWTMVDEGPVIVENQTPYQFRTLARVRG